MKVSGEVLIKWYQNSRYHRLYIIKVAKGMDIDPSKIYEI